MLILEEHRYRAVSPKSANARFVWLQDNNNDLE